MKFTFVIAVIIGLIACSNKTTEDSNYESPKQNLQKAYFASGCFWCVEEIFESVRGVKEVYSGYSGGKKSNATYSLVSAGKTNHAETVEVYYDSTLVSYQTLLKVFFASHDPTTLNQQGPDKGRQYRSIIFYKNTSEKKLAENYINLLIEGQIYDIITTEVLPFEAFYKAENYHQDYIEHHPNHPYVRSVSIPRFNNFKKKLPQVLK